MSFFKLKFNKNSENFERVEFISKTRGLTMVETLVAISILTIAVIGPLGIIAQALHTSYYTRDQMTAYYLAQEAIEYVRNLRDNEGIKITGQYVNNPETPSTDTWLSGVIFTDGNPSSPDKPQLTLNQSPITYSLLRDSLGKYKFDLYNSGDSGYLKIDSNGIYGSDDVNAKPSQFHREIYFKKTNNTNNNQDFMMVVTVYWKNGSTASKFILKEYFTNWTAKAGL